MLATISSISADPSGFLELSISPSFREPTRRRRVNRVATLDGGSVVNDGGYTDADLSFDLSFTNSEPALLRDVQRLVTTYPRLCLSSFDGVFLVAPESYTPGNPSVLRLLVLSRLSA